MPVPSCVWLSHMAAAQYLRWSDMQDHYDVKMPCHLLLAKLAAAAPGPVLTSLDRLFLPLEKTLTTRLRGEPVKQEVSLSLDPGIFMTWLGCTCKLIHVCVAQEVCMCHATLACKAGLAVRQQSTMLCCQLVFVCLVLMHRFVLVVLL